MSRVFDGNSANFLNAVADVAGTTSEVTISAFIKDDATGGSNRTFLAIGNAASGDNRRKWIQGRLLNNYAGFLQEASYSTRVYADETDVNIGTWQHVALRRSPDGSGGFTWDLVVGGTVSGSVVDEGANGIVQGHGNIAVGQTTSGSDPGKGKVAHAAIWTRSLSNAELAALASGTNPGSLDPTGQYAYYPMVDATLDNSWDTAASALTENGTVSVDAADNPTVDAPIPPATIDIDQVNLTPSSTITGTCYNYDSPPTGEVTLTDDYGYVLSRTATITDNGDGTYAFEFSMPPLPTSGIQKALAPGSVTVKVIK